MNTQNLTEKEQQIDRALTDLVGYIDNGFEIAVHYGVPRDTAAMHSKHMHSVIIRLRHLFETQ